MVIEYENETVEYPTHEIRTLKDGETVDIDFNGKYMIEFRKTGSWAISTTGRGIDGYGSPINVALVEVEINSKH